MPTELEAAGFRFVIYLNDHAPAHVHAVRNDGEVRINIAGDGVGLISAFGVKKADIRRALRIAIQNRDELLQRWIDIHGPVDE